MLKYKKVFKKMDIIIIIALLVISFIPEIVLGVKHKKNFDIKYAEITVGGKLYKKIPLTGHRGEEEYLIKTKYGTNLALIKDDQIAIIEADCADEVCMQPGFIGKTGQSLVCLPHKVMIEITGENNDDIILSY